MISGFCEGGGGGIEKEKDIWSMDIQNILFYKIMGNVPLDMLAAILFYQIYSHDQTNNTRNQSHSHAHSEICLIKSIFKK